MNIWESTVLTDKGTALQAKLVDGQTIHITKVMTGATKVPVVNLRQQTSVTDGGKEITFQPVRVEGDQTILPVLLENTGLEEGYELWQVGIYAQDPDEGEILYCLAQASAAKHIPSQTEGPGFSITWDFCFKISNTAPFEVDLNSKGLVSIEQYQIHNGEIHSLKDTINELGGRMEELNADLSELKDTKAITPIKVYSNRCVISGGYTSIGHMCIINCTVANLNVPVGESAEYVLSTEVPVPRSGHCAVTCYNATHPSKNSKAVIKNNNLSVSNINLEEVIYIQGIYVID